MTIFKNEPIGRFTLSDFGLTNLIFGIIRSTAQDIHYGNEESKNSAKIFVRTMWFEDLVEAVQQSPNEVRRLILSQRATYRKHYE